jgi:hypothetical protein
MSLKPLLDHREEPMTCMNLRIIAAPAAAMTLVKTALFSAVLVAFAPGTVLERFPAELNRGFPIVRE